MNTINEAVSNSISVALIGAGGAGVVTAGNMLMDAACKAGWYGLMRRSAGPQIRGGESAALIRFSDQPVESPVDQTDILMAFDWQQVDRFIAEIPLNENSIIITDPDIEDVPEAIIETGARIISLPIREAAKGIGGGRANMVGLGALASLIGLKHGIVEQVITQALATKGPDAIEASTSSVAVGYQMAQGIESLTLNSEASSGKRWQFTGSEAGGLGALRAGVSFVAGYPITPATEMLEWLAPRIEKLGGLLLQAEDELAAVNMLLGASFGGKIGLTVTSGPGFALMLESLGLAVASETPTTIVNVMRGGPSTGIPTKSEQSDLNIALYGLHGDAPHLVVAPTSIPDCISAVEWAVYLSEKLQTVSIVLSNQALAQSRIITSKPPAPLPALSRKVLGQADENYRRYAVTEDFVSPMAIPGTAGAHYTSSGLEHNQSGTPSSKASDHHAQLEKRQRKLTDYDYGAHWAEQVGEGEVAIITWGSCTGPVKEALKLLAADGVSAKMIAIRLLAPVQEKAMADALVGVKRVLLVEQSHSQQFCHYVRGHYDLPSDKKYLAIPGPLPVYPSQVADAVKNWR